MMVLSPQDWLVTLVALGAGAVLVRRVLGFAKKDSGPSCAHCSASPAKPPVSSQPGTGTVVMPLHVVRRSDLGIRAVGPKTSAPRR